MMCRVAPFTCPRHTYPLPANGLIVASPSGPLGWAKMDGWAVVALEEATEPQERSG